MEITYTKEGMKITHPSGVVQVLSAEDLNRLKYREELRKEEVNNTITQINTHLTETIKAKSTQ